MKKFPGWMPKQFRRRDISSNSKDVSRSDMSVHVPLSHDAIGQSLEALEPRIMLDAAGMAAATDVLADQVAAEQANEAVLNDDANTPQVVQQQKEALREALTSSASSNDLTEIVFIDRSVEGYEDLLEGIDASAEVILIDGDKDGVEFIANVLQGRSDIDAIHIISHGEAGQLNLGNTLLTQSSIQGEHADELLMIGQALSSQADILLYGCNFAQGDIGQAAANALSQATGADIAASDDLTGAEELGGDWELEVVSGVIEANTFDEQLDGFNDFDSILASAPVGEVGTTGDTLSHVTQTITLTNTYINPVVFALLPSDDGGHPAQVRIDNVTSNSFDIRLVEPFGYDGPHTQEEVSYMVFEAGNYTLSDGTKFEVGLTNSTSIQGPDADGDFHGVSFNQQFSARPTLLTQVQTDNNNLLIGDGASNRQAFLDTRTNNVSANSFDVAIERYESIGAAESLAASEQIGYFAIESVSGQWSTNADDSSLLNFVAGSTTVIDNVGSPNETVVSYGQDLTTNVNRFAAISSYNDNDPAQLRLDNDSATDMQLFIEEERSLDNEETHANETVDYFAISGNATLFATVSLDTDGDSIADDVDVDDDNDGILDVNENALLPAQEVLNLSGAQANSYTVTENGEVTITISGGDGGDATTIGGQGATISATFRVNNGDVIEYVVSNAGANGQSGGGGGSTGVFINDVLVMVAGGGGGGDNSTGAIGLGGQATLNGGSGTGTSPGAGGAGGNGGGSTIFGGTNQAAGGGGINSAGGTASAGGGGAGGGAQADTDASDGVTLVLGGAPDETGGAGGAGFTGGGGADEFIGAGGGGYSGGGAGGANGSAGGGGSFLNTTISSYVAGTVTAGTDGGGTQSDGTLIVSLISGADRDRDGVNNDLDLDSDNDGISDLQESGADAADIAADTNNDGTVSIAEAEAILGVGNADLNNDGLLDIFTATIGTSPVNSDTDSISDYLDLDSDNDGISDAIEAKPTANYSSNFANDGDVTDDDADGDGIIDIYDSNDATSGDFGGSFSAVEDTDGDGIADYIDTDSDGDGLLDSAESGLTISGSDANNDGIDDDITIGASYSDPDGVVNDPSMGLDNQVGDMSEVAYRENAAEWSITGAASVTEGATASYTIGLSGTFGLNQTASIDISLTDVSTSPTDHAALVAAVNAAIATRPELSFDGTALTYTSPANGSSMANLIINLLAIDDILVEGAETYLIALAGATGTNAVAASVNATNDDVTTTINDNDSALVTISATDATASETVTDNGEFTVDLGAVNNTGAAITVNYTISGTATAGTDYATLSGSVVIVNGQQTATINVAGIVDDALVEGDETVIATITGTSNALFTVDAANDDATVTIADNDTALNSVTISATDATASETATDDGEFTVDLGAVNNTGAAITVNYTISGTATAGTDYTTLSGSVVIANGQQTATINVTGIVDDALVEGSETVIATITGTSNALFTVDAANDDATVTIADNDTALNSVTITASDATASETATDDGEFTVDLGAVNNTGADITVNYTISGTATAGTDYTTLSGSVTIANGQQTATINVAGIVDDALVEGSETVIATITSTSNALFTVDAANDDATVTIADNDTALNSVTISATDATASETATDDGEFTIDLGAVNNTGADITVNYTISGTATAGTDYTTLSGSVTIANGQQTATINVAGIVDDAFVEGDETVIATITSTSNALFTVDAANDDATVTIADNDTALNSVTITASDATASETATDDGEFTVDLGAVNNTGADITVNYTISGTATAGTDYTTLSGSVTIANGQQTATINVAGIVDDALVEGSETVIATITSTSNALFTVDAANDDATVTIADNDTALNSVTITASDATASETATDDGEFTVDLGAVNNTGADITVNYTVSGTATATGDYTALSGSVVIVNGQQTATINVAGIVDDAFVEGDETVIATITSTSNALFTVDAANDDATVTIADNDTALNSVTISATDATASETATDDGEFTVDLGAVNNTGADITVNYTISGTATAGTDYTTLSGSVTIANGQQTATINVAGIVDDALVEGSETVIATITSTSNALFTVDAANDDATVTIADNDTALNSVTITASDATASETATDDGEFTVDLGAVNNTGADITVNYTVSGTATATGDYTALSGSVVIVNGQQTATINVAGIVDDAFVEGDETVIATITSTSNALFTVDAANDDATVTIADNDTALNSVTITASDATASETATDDGEFTVDLGAVNNTGSAITVNYTVSGTATATGDYTALSGSVVIVNGQQTATINVAGIVDDALVEGSETVIATITSTSNALFTVDTANDDATVTIADNDNALNNVTINATDATASETATDDGEFTVDLGAVNNTGADITVNYTISGTATAGTDYTTLSGSVVIANGQQTATIDVAGIVDDALIEGDETVIATITGTDNALFTVDASNDDATVTIADNDTALNSVTISATDATASETATDDGEFTIDLGAVNNTGADITVNYTISGTATAGTDYTTLSGSVTIANGQQTATINVAGIVDDAFVEGDETVIATITGTSNALFTVDAANDDATVTIADNDTALNSVTITASDATASETATDDGEFTVDLGAVNNTGADITVNYTISGTATAGTDYTTLSGSVTIANGQQTATINVAGIVDDALVEGSETVIATITSTSNALFTVDAANDDATVTIADNDTALNSVTITASDATASETATDDGEFTVDLGAVNNTGADITVNYTVSGTATATGDYTALSGSVVIVNGQQTATINVAGIVDDALVEGSETVIATITGTSNALFTVDAANDDATVTIADNNTALNSVTITASDAIASETATDDGEFTVDLGAVNNTGADITVNYTVSGTATATGDYTALSGSVVIVNGQQTATINVAGIVDDAFVEGDETVIATITSTSNALFTVDAANDDATVTIADNDTALNSVTITASDATASETATDDGEFTVDLGAVNNTGADITVNYTISGTATAGTDYTTLSGSVVIANGQQTATIDVAGIVDDALIEGDETVIATITGTDNALFTVDASNDDATVTIADNDTALNSVTITASDATASETATDDGEFTVDLGAVNNTGADITVNYTVSGTATATGDYTALSGSVVIVNGQQTATINVAGIVDDALVEGSETVIATITGTSNALFTVDAANDDATVTIADNDTALNSVTISATDATASETATDDGEFTVDLGAVNNTGADITVNYTVSGTATATGDYTALSGSVVIVNGQQTATINVAGIVDDALVEGSETVIATITSTSNALFTVDAANDDATVTIADNDTALNSVTITASDATASETATDDGEFTVDLGAVNNTGADITVNYTISGTATAGTDYTTLSGSVTIANGQQTATINVAGIVDDAFVEGDETVIATITSTSNALFTVDAANDDATVTIADNDTALNSVTITASDATASETATDDGEFTVDLGAVNNTGADITVNYTISGTATAGTDYTTLSGSVTIANGQQTATINVAGIVDDAFVEGDETVIATITSTSNALFTVDAANDDATVTIADNDTALNSVTITASDATASETATDDGEFTVDLGAVNNTGADITVNYTISGTATAGTDYTTLSGSVTIANGQQTATINVAGIVDDALVEGSETVIATITSTSNALFTVDTANDDATVTIADNDNALNNVTINATDATASETATDDGEFTVDLGAVNNTGADITVNYTISGTATAGTDYTTLSGSVVIANGQQTATIDVAGIVDDALIEGDETVIATITGTDNALFTVDASNDDATVTIADNDTALNSVTISATDATASETATDDGEFTIDLGAVNNTGADITVNYTISGTATAGTDYTTLSGSVTIANGQQTATINVAGIVDDAFVEGDETVIATITGTSNALFTVDAANDDATVTIADNDTALNSVTITASDATASETATDDGEFTVDLGAVNNTGADITVNYTISGTATAGTDYTTLSGSVTIANGQQTATINVAGIVDDALVEGSETVIATITSTSNALFTVDAANDDATVTIADNDTALNSVTITASDATASETATDDGEFTVDLGAVNNTGADITVNYTVSGTATATGDYTALSGSVVIVNGQQTATINVAGIVDDALVEGSETVIATITGTSNALFTVDAANDDATVTIADNNTALNSVTITASDAIASETATDDGEFTVDLGAVNNTGADITVNYTVSGTATATGDYTALSGSVVIVNGQQTATINVAGIVDDAFVEGDETVIATITSTSNALFTVDAANDDATVTIADNDTALNSVTITASDATASETATDDGEFTVDLGAVNNTGADITVNYTISGTATAGTDYTTLSGSVVIANGQQTATIDVAGIVDDALIEGDETVIATITGTDNALFTVDASNDDATVTIADNDTALNSVTITASDATASETATDDGEFTVDLGAVNNTGADITVNYTVSGTATATGDYTALSGSVVIVNGQQTATINVAGIVDDALVEGSETVIATITGTSNALFTVDAANDDATVTIADNDTALNSVTISATDATASETATDDGEFTVDLGAVNNTGADITVNYTVSGTATATGDYTALSGSVVIVNGQQTATINVAGIVDDALVEGSETVIATITSTSNALFTVDAANDDATVTIADNDTALNSVTITASDATASETATDDGEFTVDLGAVNNTGADITVNYTISGTATAGTDYTTLSGSVTIANGQQTATINVAGIVDDAFVEGDETVIATITSTSNALFTVDAANDDATVTIADNDTALNSVTITASDATASETATDDGEFTVDLGAVNNTGADITVNYTISGTATAGTDYTTLSGSVTIANGQQTATINVAGIVDDAFVEGDETVIATITSTSNALFTVDAANDDATVTIADNDTALNSVTITASDATASETATDDGEFTVDLGAVNNTGADITVNYTISGTATAGTDYTTLSGSVTIANGQQTATINVAGIVDDALVEGSETVIATITSTSNALFTVDTANDDATVTIADNDNALNNVTINATDATASETATDDGEFTVDLGAVNNTGADITVNYTISGTATAGTDYTTLSGSVVIANGQQTATIDVAGIVDDALIEGDETVIATITGTDNALFTVDASNDDATVTIADNDTALNSVTISATDATASETATDDGEFTIDLGAVNNTGADITVNYTISGTATAGTDYTTLSGSVTIANGQQTATINVAGIVDDAFVEGDETVIATITGTSNALFTVDAANDDATVTIADNDTALNSVTITASDATASETATDDGEFTVDLGAVNNTGADITVNYTISGTATAGTDYTTLSGSVTIANGQQTATINVAGIVDDALVEGSETVIATITSTSNALFTVDAANDDATVTIADNDTALNSVTITASDATASETATDDGEFTVDLGAVNNTGADITVNYTISGTATAGTDYTTLSGSVVIANGQQTATIDVAGIVDDALVEGSETVIATITSTSNALFTVDTANDDATVTIADNDNALNNVTINATDATASETATDDGEFTVDLGAVNNTGADITVNYTVSGTATATGDYTALSGSVVIANGQQTATINVAGIVDDALIEGDETVIATITGTDNALFTVDASNDDATVTIADNDTALNSVTISATDATASETATDDGEFTIDLGAVNNTGADITVNYTISGTATAGTDYTTLSGSVTIANGQQTATINVAGIVDDAFVEGDETVIATITGTSNALFTVDAANDDATVTIADNDTALNSVTITASDAIASETATDDGEFTVDLGAVNNTGSAITVNYTVSGTATATGDYTVLSGSVVIANGQQTATINVSGIVDDALIEGDETVIATITSTSNALFTVDTANDDAVVTITDNDTALNSVTISATDATASETATDNGEFTIDLGAVNNTGSAITVNYTVSGTATATNDYTALSGSVTIANGQQMATINVAGIVDDALVEGDETVIATITATSNTLFTVDAANDNATVIIADNENAFNGVTISATDANANETLSDSGEFTIDLGAVNNTGADIIVSYTVGGTATAGSDYTALSGSVIIPDGQQSITINVTGIVDDALVEGSETVTATITSISNALFTVDPLNDQASVTIGDNDDALNSVTISATDANASETPTDNGEFTIDLGAVNNTGADITVNYTVSGTATATGDYVALSGSVVIANGQQTATINVAGIVDDALVEGSETVIATITGTSNALFTVDTANDDATVTITDNDNALNSVTISATDATASETAMDNGEFTIDLGAVNNTGAAIIVNYTVSGTAAATSDYTVLSGSVTIANGQQTAMISVAGIVDDALVEGSETVIATITGTSNALFTVDAANDDATVTIVDNDNALNSVTISATDATASEAGVNPGQFTVDLGAVNNTGAVITVNYIVSGTATATGDYTALSGSVTIANGQQTAIINVAGIVDDAIVEGDETVVATITSTDNALFTVDAANDDATVTILDNDTASVTISDVIVNEAAGTLTFTAILNNAVQNGFSVDATYSNGAAVGGVDFDNTTDTLTFVGVAGEMQSFTVAITDDLIVEANENFNVSLSNVVPVSAPLASIDVTDTAQATIIDNDSAIVSIVANDAVAAEPGDDGQFTVSLSNVSSTDTVISYTIGGDATSAVDFTPVTGTVTILAGQTSALIDVNVIDDVLLEDNETVAITLTGINSGDTDISIGAANNDTVTISDNDTAEVTISVTDSSVTEEGDAGQFSVNISNPSDTDTIISYTISGGATNGVDYQTLTGIVTIPAGSISAVIDVVPIDDQQFEGDEAVTLTLNSIPSGDADITLGAANSATVLIVEDDLSVVSENLLNLNEVESSNRSDSVNVDRLRVPGAVIDAVSSIDASLFGDQLNSYAIDNAELNAPGTLTGFVYRSVVAETGSSGLSSIFPLRIGESDVEIDNSDQLLIKSWSINKSLFLEVLYIDTSGYELNTINITQADGEALPQWLLFDADKGLLSGNAPLDVEGIKLRVLVELSDGVEVLRYIEVDVSNAVITEISDGDDLELSGVQPFSNQIDMFAKQFAEGDLLKTGW